MTRTLPKLLVLATAVVISLVVPIATRAIDAAQLQGTTPAAPPVDPDAPFEVASIEPFDPSATFRISMTPNRYDVAGMTLRLVLSQAFVTPVNRIIGLRNGPTRSATRLRPKCQRARRRTRCSR
jgi:hypothetical protein